MKKKFIIGISILLVVLITILCFCLQKKQNADIWSKPEERDECKRYWSAEKIESLLNPTDPLYAIKNFDGVKIEYNDKVFDMESILLKDLNIDYGIYNPELEINEKNTFLIPPKSDFLITTHPSSNKKEPLTVGIVNMDKKSQFPDECAIRYLRYRNGTSVKICGITIGDSREKIVNMLGQSDPSSNHVAYLFVQNQHLYDIKFYIDSKTDLCKEITVDVDGYSEHGTITY